MVACIRVKSMLEFYDNFSVWLGLRIKFLQDHQAALFRATYNVNEKEQIIQKTSEINNAATSQIIQNISFLAGFIFLCKRRLPNRANPRKKITAVSL